MGRDVSRRPDDRIAFADQFTYPRAPFRVVPKMRIALCLEYPLAFKGGVSVIARALAEALSTRHEIVLVSPDGSAEFHRLQKEIPLHSHIRWEPATVSKAQSRQLAAALQQRGVELAHFHFGGNYGWGSRLPGRSPVTHAANCGIRVISTVHSVVSLLEGYCGPGKPLWFKLGLFPLVWVAKMHLLAHVEREIAVSQHDGRLLRRWYRPRAGCFIQFYHSRLAEEEYARAEEPREKLIVNVGHIAGRKGQLVLLEAFRRLADAHPDWNLAFVGSFGDALIERQMRQAIVEARLTHRVLLPGPQENAGQWMRRAAIYVQPSLEEALGLALQEAMFHGCPCVGTRVGGIPELMQPGTGVLVAPNDAANLAEALVRLMENPGERERLGRAAAASVRAREMTAAAMVRRHLELYEARHEQ